MPIRDQITWGRENPFADPRLKELPELIRGFRRGNYRGWRAGVFENQDGDLPEKPLGYWREHYLGPPELSGSLRIVLGRSSEVYITGNHYEDFRQIVGIPGT